MRGPETRGTGAAYFHYDKRERTGPDAGSNQPKPKGLFARNRSLAITLLDVLLLVLIFLLYQFVLAPQAGVRRVDGVEFRLTSFQFDDDVYVVVAAHRYRESRAATMGNELVSVRFPDGSETLDVVPAVVGQEFSFRRVVTGESAAELAEAGSVTVFVTALAEDFELSNSIDR